MFRSNTIYGMCSKLSNMCRWITINLVTIKLIIEAFVHFYVRLWKIDVELLLNYIKMHVKSEKLTKKIVHQKSH